jgi:hypothetical protein
MACVYSVKLRFDIDNRGKAEGSSLEIVAGYGN